MERQHFVVNLETRKKLMSYLVSQDNKMQSMLVWCSIGILIIYILIVLNLARFYPVLKNGHAVYAIIMLVADGSLFALFLGIQWRVCTYKPSSSRQVAKEILHFKIAAAEQRIKRLMAYLLTYLLIALASGLCCWYDGAFGVSRVLTFITPAGILIYGAGLCLLLKIAYLRKMLLDCFHLIEK
jgi:hypothetical protein